MTEADKLRELAVRCKRYRKALERIAADSPQGPLSNVEIARAALTEHA